MLPNLKMVTKAEWIAALRSGKYIQTIGALRENGCFCCLGVACDLLGGEWDVESDEEDHEDAFGCSFNTQELRTEYTYGDEPSEVVARLLGIDEELLASEICSHLIILNDTRKWNFDQIADWLEADTYLKPRADWFEIANEMEKEYAKKIGKELAV